jgi:two-component system chemotaxis response regulator CheB
MSVRVLVVDDSPTMRGVITATLRADPEIEVVGQAADPNEARLAIKQLAPDVITLDIEMPNMDGISLKKSCGCGRPR